MALVLASVAATFFVGFMAKMIVLSQAGAATMNRRIAKTAEDG